MKTLLLTLLTLNTLYADITNYKVVDANNLEVKSYSLDIQRSKLSSTCKMYDEENDVMKTNITDSNGSTTSFTWKSESTDIQGEVIENILYYKGLFKGEEVDISIALDDAPFIFNTRDALSSFILSEKESMYLYVTSSSSLSAYKFEAEKEDEVELIIDDVTYEAIEVSFSMSGFIGLFVGGDTLYFDKHSGKFLKRLDSRRDRVEVIEH